MKRDPYEKKTSGVIDLGAASRETKAMTFGSDDSKSGLWVHSGLTLD